MNENAMRLSPPLHNPVGKMSECSLAVELEFSRARPELIAFSHFIRAVSAIQTRVLLWLLGGKPAD